jgi:hypothetical protein
VNDADVAPAGTVTLDGVTVVEELSLSDTTVPPLAAGAVNVTVPVDDVPPTTVAGFRLRLDSDAPAGAGSTVITLKSVVPFSVALRVSDTVPEPGCVEIAKFALVAPAGTITLAGTLADVGIWLPRSTGTSTDWALWSVTVPVDDWPAVTRVGLTVKPVRTAGGGGEVDGFTVMMSV